MLLVCLFLFCNSTHSPPALGPQGMMVTENIVSEVADRMGMSAEKIRVGYFISCLPLYLHFISLSLSRLRIYYV